MQRPPSVAFSSLPLAPLLLPLPSRQPRCGYLGGRQAPAPPPTPARVRRSCAAPGTALGAPGGYPSPVAGSRASSLGVCDPGRPGAAHSPRGRRPPSCHRSARLQPTAGLGTPVRALAPRAQAGEARWAPLRGVHLAREPARATSGWPMSCPFPHRCRRLPGGEGRTLAAPAARCQVRRVGPRGARRTSARPSSRCSLARSPRSLLAALPTSPAHSGRSPPPSLHATPAPSSPAATLTPECLEAPSA